MAELYTKGSTKREDHTGKLIDLFKAVIRNGLKMSPRKCKLFKKSLVFMGLTMMVEDGMAKMKPLKSRIEAILKVKPPTTVKECRSFCGMVNYMSIFLPSLQEKLIPIYLITRKGVPFYWGRLNNRQLLIVSNKTLQMHQCY